MLNIKIVHTGYIQLNPRIGRALHESILHCSPSLEVIDFDLSNSLKNKYVIFFVMLFLFLNNLINWLFGIHKAIFQTYMY